MLQYPSLFKYSIKDPDDSLYSYGYFGPKHKDVKIFENHLKPVMLAGS